MNFYTLLLLFFFVAQFGLAQSPVPERRKLSSGASTRMINEYLGHKAYQNTNKKKYEYNLPYYKKVEDGMVKLIRKGQFYDDPSLSSYVYGIKNKLTSHYELKNEFIHVVVDKSSVVNAKALGRCSIILNNGLLATIDSEEQLAFILSHEIAHLELDHIYQKLILIDQDKLKSDIKRIVTTDAKLEDMESLKKEIYSFASFSRKKEREADSLGYLIYSNAYNSKEAPLEALVKIDVSNPKHQQLGLRLFKPFHSKAAPFNEALLREDLDIFDKEKNKVLFLDVDSIISHPEMPVRLAKLSDQISKHAKKEAVQQTRLTRLNKTSAYEVVEASMMTNSYTKALYSALKLKYQFPDDKMTSTLIARVMIKIHDDKRDGLFDMSFSRYTVGYSSDLKLVHNFIRNTSYQDLAGLTYNMLGMSRNFDQGEAEHYRLLASICKRMSKDNEVSKIRYIHQDRFGKVLQLD
ncbi:M48 family metalloprotease [Reichenbachiella sp.]|uniref:M48 family metalloprotease n=1 Tax=Reichenbachiella sp. TaxID=2184521 RepID=UPI003BAE3B7E